METMPDQSSDNGSGRRPSRFFVWTTVAGAAIGGLLGAWGAYDLISHGGNQGYPGQIFATGLFGGAVVGALCGIVVRIWGRFERLGKDSLAGRSILLAIAAAGVFACGFAAALFGWNGFESAETWNPFSKSLRDLAAACVALLAGTAMCAACGAALCFLDARAVGKRRWAKRLGIASLGLLAVWPVASIVALSGEGRGDHDAASGMAAALFVLVLPLMMAMVVGAFVGLLAWCGRMEENSSANHG